MCRRMKPLKKCRVIRSSAMISFLDVEFRHSNRADQGMSSVRNTGIYAHFRDGAYCCGRGMSVPHLPLTRLRLQSGLESPGQLLGRPLTPEVREVKGRLLPR